MGGLAGELRVDRAALRENYKILDAMTGNAVRVAPAVKANAYGLGAKICAPEFYQAGARAFFVALPQEGVALRSVLPDDTDIYILHGFSARDSGEYKAYNLIPVLNSIDQIKEFKNSGGKCILHFDTGMNRLGIAPEDVMRAQEEAADLDIVYVMSHFASSDEKDSTFNATQSERFKKIAQSFPKAKKSLANSSGIFRSPDYHYDLVRSGIALYGGNPVPEIKNPMRPVVSLHVPVLQVHRAAKGETAGYNQSYVFEKDVVLATVSLGYADGFLRSLSNKGILYWKDYALPVRGRVSMDLTICDFSAVPENDLPRIGDMIEVLGPHQSVDDLARAGGTIGYEVLTSLQRLR